MDIIKNVKGHKKFKERGMFDLCAWSLKKIKAEEVAFQIVDNEEKMEKQKEAVERLKKINFKMKEEKFEAKHFAKVLSPQYQDTPTRCMKNRSINSIIFGGAVKEAKAVKSVISNFNISIEKRIKKISAEKEEKIYLELKIFWQEKIFSLYVNLDDFSDLAKIIIKKYPQCVVYRFADFSNLMAEKYGIFDNSSENTEVIYLFGGWYKEKNRWIFLNNSMRNVNSNLVLSPNEENAKTFFKCYMEISSKKSKLIVILLYALYSYFAVFYDELKIDGLRSLLYISAPTGTGKTSLVKILSSAILENNTRPLLRFDDTIASIEESLANSLDRLTLIDDFYAKGTKWDDNAFKAKASAVTRIIGDGFIRGKMGADRKPRKDRKYRGGIIATGEFMELNTFSSYLRCWVVNFKTNEIYFNNYLASLQQYPIFAQSFFSLWIKWLEKKQELIMKNIPIIHQRNLLQIKKFCPKIYARLASNEATFLVVEYFFNLFSNEFDLGANSSDFYSGIQQEFLHQCRLLEELSPVQIIVAALDDALDNAYLKIATDEYEFRTMEYDGFSDDKNFYIITSRMENAIENFATKNNYGIKFNNDLKEALNAKNIMDKLGNNFNGKYSKNRLVEPKRPRMYAIRKEALKNGK